MGESFKVGDVEGPPSFLRFLLLCPLVGEQREEGNGAAVLVVIGEHAALRNGAKAVLIHLRQGDVAWVDGEDGIFRRIAPNPIEGLHPVIPGLHSWKFNVGAVGVGVPLDEQHAGKERDK